MPGNRVFVICGSLNSKVTDKVSDEVQEWNLEDHTVRLCQRIPHARTSAACYFHGRFIYVVGGNVANSQSTDSVCKLDIYTRKWTQMPSLCEQRANAGTMVIGDYLYAFGGFQTGSFGQVGVASYERLHLSNPDAKWEIQIFCEGSIEMGKVACFYLIDITNYLQASAKESEKALAKSAADENSGVEQTIMFIGGWSKTNYLTKINLFYPKQNLLTSWTNQGHILGLQEPDMVTKRPIFYKDCLYVLGRHHIHVIDLKNKTTSIQKLNGENKALEVASTARLVFETLED